MGHVTGDEKYECVIWNVFMRFSMMVFGSVYCESLRGSFLGVCIYIFGIAMPLQFRMVGWGARGCVVYLVLGGMGPITILVLFQGW